MRARVTMLVLAVALFAPPAVARSQERARFTSLDDALRAQGILAGRTGPQDVNWIDGGARFSFTLPLGTPPEVPQSEEPVAGKA